MDDLDLLLLSPAACGGSGLGGGDCGCSAEVVHECVVEVEEEEGGLVGGVVRGCGGGGGRGEGGGGHGGW